jgi:hypothetical protein
LEPSLVEIRLVENIGEEDKMMRRKPAVLLLGVAMLAVAALACGVGKPAPATTAPPPTAQPAEPTAASTEAAGGEEDRGDYDTVFPLPEDVQNFIGEGGEGQVNFQTSLSFEETIEFYRQALTTQGLSEREILTVIEGTAFSMVFDGWPNGRAIVIQGVDLGESMNVNIRFEDV